MANSLKVRLGDVKPSASALHHLHEKKENYLFESTAYDFEKFLSQGPAIVWHKRCYLSLAGRPAFLPQRKFLPVAERLSSSK